MTMSGGARRPDRRFAAYFLLTPDGFEEGDIIISNVPYRSGTHLNDGTLIMPVFAGGRPLAFAASKGHWSEIGGMHFLFGNGASAQRL